MTPRLLLALGAVSLAAGAATLKTDPGHSKVTARFTQMSVPVEAEFRKVQATIDYDPARPEAAKASVAIDTASLDVGDAEINKEVGNKEWFNSAQFPKATFVSSAIKPAGAGKLAVTGKLTIKGRAADVSFPLTVSGSNGHYVFDGQVPIRRLAFNVGEGEWKDTGTVADEVVIKFRVAADK
ncbi:MAG: YceI family protein [Telluria sp.]